MIFILTIVAFSPFVGLPKEVLQHLLIPLRTLKTDVIKQPFSLNINNELEALEFSLNFLFLVNSLCLKFTRPGSHWALTLF